ncbi:hypothetical protein D3C85_1499920 [compost metagenome]
MDRTENSSSDEYETVIFDPEKAGVYNKEPLYMIDNSHLHKIKWTPHNTGMGFSNVTYIPKYFYDEDGYLIVYDEYGMREPAHMTTFIYE